MAYGNKEMVLTEETNWRIYTQKTTGRIDNTGN